MKLLLNLKTIFINKKQILKQSNTRNNNHLGHLHYVQGQELNKTRQYFYYVDHNGMLFLDDSKMKNFTTCFKDKKFLQFFFRQIRFNTTGLYEKQFPFLSLCGKETNFIRCDDLPIVFTHIITDNDRYLLSYGYTDSLLTVPFEPQTLYMKPESGESAAETEGRVYHKAMERVGGIGLIRSALALDLSKHFKFNDKKSNIPTHFEWCGQTYELTNELQNKIKN